MKLTKSFLKQIIMEELQKEVDGSGPDVQVWKPSYKVQRGLGGTYRVYDVNDPKATLYAGHYDQKTLQVANVRKMTGGMPEEIKDSELMNQINSLLKDAPLPKQLPRR